MKSSEPQILNLPEADLPFLFLRDRFRTLRLFVKPDASVLVKAPLRTPLAVVFAFMRARLDWIRNRQAFFLKHQTNARNFPADDVVWFLGKPFTLHFVEAERGSKARLHGNRLEIPCAHTCGAESAEERKSLVLRWQKELAEQILPRRLARWQKKACEILGDHACYTKVTVRNAKSRWGSCTVTGRISLASRIITLPLPLIDYVLCHELCHLRRMDHSAAFHDCLTRLLPDAAARRQRIRIWSLEHPS